MTEGVLDNFCEKSTKPGGVRNDEPGAMTEELHDRFLDDVVCFRFLAQVVPQATMNIRLYPGEVLGQELFEGISIPLIPSLEEFLGMGWCIGQKRFSRESVFPILARIWILGKNPEEIMFGFLTIPSLECTAGLSRHKKAWAEAPPAPTFDPCSVILTDTLGRSRRSLSRGLFPVSKFKDGLPRSRIPDIDRGCSIGLRLAWQEIQVLGDNMRFNSSLTLQRALCLALLLFSVFALAPNAWGMSSIYEKDVEFALAEVEKACGNLIKQKKIDWRKVSSMFLAEAKDVENDSDHWLLLYRLIARLRDGHAAVRPLEKGRDVKWPETKETGGPGLFLCRVGKKIYVKNSWNAAGSSGVKPGMEILAVNGVSGLKWLQQRIDVARDLNSFSTDQQAFYHACHKGLVEEIGTRIKMDLRDLKGKRKKKTLSFAGANQVQWGPAYPPAGMDGDKDVRYGRTERGNGYVHIRRCKGNLPERMDEALLSLGKISGLILDFRGNTGGGYDHAGFFGRFVPKGEILSFHGTYESRGAQPYGGKMIVIVDGGTASAAETGSGMFKENERAYVIGESSTAGMSSQKTTIELPSKLFSLYVSTRSNMASFNDKKGIEGIGIIPHEIVEYKPRDLAEAKDTLILRAEKLLARFPKSKIRYQAKKP